MSESSPLTKIIIHRLEGPTLRTHISVLRATDRDACLAFAALPPAPGEETQPVRIIHGALEELPADLTLGALQHLLAMARAGEDKAMALGREQ